LKDGKPFLHLHAFFARRDFSILGGHLREARVHPTLEVWLQAEDLPNSPVFRLRLDPLHPLTAPAARPRIR
jgi:predicted DNA-binding protein with PD1-like motif